MRFSLQILCLYFQIHVFLIALSQCFQGTNVLSSLLYFQLIQDINTSTSEEVKCLFPVKPNSDKLFAILKIQIEQSGLPKSALIHTNNKSNNLQQIWNILPFSVSPPPLCIFRASAHLSWSASTDLKIIFICYNDKVVIYELTSIAKGTLGSWHQRQVFEFESNGKISSLEHSVAITLTENAHVAIVIHQGITYFFRLSQTTPLKYEKETVRMKSSSLTYQLFPRSLFSHGGTLSDIHRGITLSEIHRGITLSEIHRGSTPNSPLFMVTSDSEYQQTDGQVNLFQICNGSATLIQKLNCVCRASLFGHFVVTVIVDFDERSEPEILILVSAPFAKVNSVHGEGCIYVYSFAGAILKMVQTLTCPTNTGNPGVCHFGKSLDVSTNGRFMVVSNFNAGRGNVFLYEYSPRFVEGNSPRFVKGNSPTRFIEGHSPPGFIEGRFNHVRTFIPESILLQDFGKTLSVDNSGTIILSDDFQVYFYLHFPKQNNVVPITCMVKHQKSHAKEYLRNFSPNRLRISRRRKSEKSKQSKPKEIIQPNTIHKLESIAEATENSVFDISVDKSENDHSFIDNLKVEIGIGISSHDVANVLSLA